MEQRNPVFDQQTKSIADNVLLLAIARLSMALSLPALGLMSWLGGAWLDGKFEAQDDKIAVQREAAENQSKITTSRIETGERAAAARIETAESTARIAVTQAAQVNERLIAVETKQTEDRASSERFQNAVLQRLDRMQDSIVNMSNAVAALTALQAERKP